MKSQHLLGLNSGSLVCVANVFTTTVKPPNKGHIGDRPIVPCREVVLFSEVLLLNLSKIS